MFYKYNIKVRTLYKATHKHRSEQNSWSLKNDNLLTVQVIVVQQRNKESTKSASALNQLRDSKCIKQ